MYQQTVSFRRRPLESDFFSNLISIVIQCI
ncbi:hypothetical protein CNY89_26210 [Amaricoccus sp. HAR-UPW-R2A-40]|nr:hypothetical protein CNY89_26210 [Amaricoccus sp. HAR-UPW-R2A-40]